MDNYKLVSQWAASLNAEKAFKEILDFKAKYPWAKLPESITFISKLYEDLPTMLKIIMMQEKQNAILRRSDQITRGYIHANNMADEIILDDLKKKFNIDI